MLKEQQASMANFRSCGLCHLRENGLDENHQLIVENIRLKKMVL